MTRSRNSRSDEGFTLLETLVALVMLATATMLFAQSVSIATGQLAGADRLIAAANLGARLMAEAELQPADGVMEGVDEPSGLKWRRITGRVTSGEVTDGVDQIISVTVDVYKREVAEPLLHLQTAIAGPDRQ